MVWQSHKQYVEIKIPSANAIEKQGGLVITSAKHLMADVMINPETWTKELPQAGIKVAFFSVSTLTRVEMKVNA